MKVIGHILFLALMAQASSCIFVVTERPEKGDLLVTDSLQGHAPVDSLVPQVQKPLDTVAKDSVLKTFSGKSIDTKNVLPLAVVEYAKTLIGTPYRYASSDPAIGFDCSGFITYVFHHFGIIVPRSSRDFTEVGQPIAFTLAKPGDLILFTGTDSTEKYVGHMGLVISNDKEGLQFIHSSSGKANGVTVSPLSGYYQSRFVKTIRIFPQNG